MVYVGDTITNILDLQTKLDNGPLKTQLFSTQNI